MKLSIVTGVCGRNEITRRWLDTTIANCSQPHELIIVSNGSTDEEDLQLDKWLDELSSEGWKTFKIESADPLGPTAALNIGVQHATGDVVAMLHNDVLIKNKEWDSQVINFYDKTLAVGVVGLAGARIMGHPRIYKDPYQIWHLQRFDVYMSLENWKDHERVQHILAPIRVAVLDGLALFIKKSVFDQIGGFDENYIHHMYDNDLCLRALEVGYKNYVVPIPCEHLNGQTANYPRYNEWVKSTHTPDSDAGIHKASHEYFYDKWAGKLPVEVLYD